MIGSLQAKQACQRLRQALALEQRRHKIRGRYVVDCQNLIMVHLTVTGNLPDGLFLEFVLAATGELDRR